MNTWAIVIGALGIAALLSALYLTYKGRESLPAGTTQQLIPRKVGGYKNTQTFELSNFDPDTFMPRKIVAHREVTPL